MAILVTLGFWTFLLGAFAIGWQAGDRQDRIMMVVICAAAGLTVAAHSIPGEYGSRAGVLAVDCALLFAVVRYALVSRRHWPLWFAGMQAAAIAISIVSLLLPPMAGWVLEMLSLFWALPALLVMVLGLLKDQRGGVANAPSLRG